MKIKILIVEDDSVSALYSKRTLSSLGYDVIGITSACADTIIFIKENQPDLILMDISLGGNIDGIDINNKISDFINIPIIYLTNHTDEEILKRVKETNPYGYLVKPIKKDTLNTAIEIAHNKFLHNIQVIENEQKYHRILENLPSMICYINPHDNNIQYVNEAFCQYIGKNRDEVVDKSLIELLDQESELVFKSLCDTISLDNIFATSEFKRIITDRVKWFRLTCHGFFDDRNEFSECHFALHDISDLKEANELFSRKSIYLEMVNCKQTCISEISNLSDIEPLSLNKFLDNLVNLIKNSVKGLFDISVCIEYENNIFKSEIFNQTNCLFEFEMKCSYVNIIIFKVYLNSDSSAILEKQFFTDISRSVKSCSEKIIARTELNKMQKEIIEISEKEKSRIGRDIHDNLGQILTGLSFLSEAIKDKLDVSILTEFNEITKLTNLAIDTCKNISKDLLQINLKNEGLIFSIERLIESFREIYSIDFSISIIESFNIEDYFICTQVYRIIQEAINNAVKHSGGSKISVTIKEKNNDFQVSIKDDGSGIVDTLFTGLGMETMKYRANLMNTTLEIANIIDKGVEVAFTISKE